MATYKGIQGYTVQKLSSDPPAEQAVGQLWYNSGSGAFKIGTQGSGAWSTGGSLNVARDLQAGAGTQTAGIIGMGEPPVSGGAGVAVEKYNGTTWTTSTGLGTYRFGGGASGGPGAQTAFLVFGGSQSAPGIGNTESWNGSSWTEKNDLNSARVYTTGTPMGTSTAALCIGGGGPGAPNSALTETWDGTCWTEGSADLNQGRELESGVGTTTAALCVGGKQTWPGTSTFDNVEEYNGSAWTEKNDLNTARGGMQNGGAGTSTAAMVGGGETPTKVANVEVWDGTSWTESSDIPAAVTRTGGIGSSTAANISGGSNPSTQVSATSDWTDPVYTIKTVTVS